jgi:hypothetical protein
MRVYGQQDFLWRGDALCLGNREIVHIVRDEKYPQVWRVKMPDGRLSDLCNRTRIKDAALSLASVVANQKAKETSADAA